MPASGGVAPQVMAGLAALDLLVPIENGFRPNLAKAQRVFRFVGEGGLTLTLTLTLTITLTLTLALTLTLTLTLTVTLP